MARDSVRRTSGLVQVGLWKIGTFHPETADFRRMPVDGSPQTILPFKVSAYEVSVGFRPGFPTGFPALC